MFCHITGTDIRFGLHRKYDLIRAQIMQIIASTMHIRFVSNKLLLITGDCIYVYTVHGR